MKALSYCHFPPATASRRPITCRSWSILVSRARATPSRREPSDWLSVVHPPRSPRKLHFDAATAGFVSAVRAGATPVLRWTGAACPQVASVQAWVARTKCRVECCSAVYYKVKADVEISIVVLYLFITTSFTESGTSICPVYRTMPSTACYRARKPCGVWAGVRAQARRVACSGARFPPCGGVPWLGSQRAEAQGLFSILDEAPKKKGGGHGGLCGVWRVRFPFGRRVCPLFGRPAWRPGRCLVESEL